MTKGQKGFLFPYKLNQKNADYLSDFISICDDDYLNLLFENQSSFTNSFNGLKCAIERYKKENILTKTKLEKSIINHKNKNNNKNYNTNFNQTVSNFRKKNYDYNELEKELLGWN